MKDRKRLIYSGLMLSLLGYSLILYIGLAREVLGSPVEMDYGEGIVLWQAQHVTELATAYHPLGQFPYIVFHYPPVFHYAARAANLIIPNLLTAGRAVSVFAMFGIAIAIGLTVLIGSRSHGWTGCAAALIAALITIHLDTTFWSLLMRVDTLGIFFVFLGILFYAAARTRPWLEFAAFGCFVIALFCKQTLLAGAAACGVCTLISDVRRGLRIGLYSTAAVGAIASGFSLATHGQFLRHLFVYNLNPMDLRQWFHYGRINLEASAPLVLLAFMPVLSAATTLASAGSWSKVHQALKRQLAESDRSRLIVVASLHMLLALAATASAAKLGAYYNYFLEWNLTCCTMVGVAIATLLYDWSKTTLAEAPALGLGLFGAVLVAFSTLHGLNHLDRIDAQKESDHRAAVEALREIRGPVYSENMTIAIEAGKQLPAEPAIITCVARTRMWNEQPFLELIRNRQFGAILVSTNLGNLGNPLFYSPGVRAAITQAYRLVFRIGPYEFYLPG
jgi:hypothetical protein